MIRERKEEQYTRGKGKRGCSIEKEKNPSVKSSNKPKNI